MRITSTFNPTQSFLEGFKTVLYVFLGLAYAFIKLAAKGQASAPGMAVMLVLMCLIVVLPVAIYMFIKHRNYANTYYELDDEKVIYFDGFFSPNRKEILYKRILEVDFRQGFLQKQFGLGTITLVTNSSSSNQPASGITIKDAQNPHDVYEAVKKIVYPHIKNS